MYILHYYFVVGIIVNKVDCDIVVYEYLYTHTHTRICIYTYIYNNNRIKKINSFGLIMNLFLAMMTVIRCQ